MMGIDFQALEEVLSEQFKNFIAPTQ